MQRLWPIVILTFLLAACAPNQVEPTPETEVATIPRPEPTPTLPSLPVIVPSPPGDISRVAVSPDTVPFLSELDIYDGMAAVQALAMHPAGEILVAGDAAGDLFFWNPRDGQLLHTLDTGSEAVQALAYSFNGSWLAANFADGDGRVQLWYDPLTAEGQVLDTSAAGRQVAFHPAGQHLAVGLENGDVELWLLPGGEQFYTLATGSVAVAALAFSPDGRWLVVATDSLWRYDLTAHAAVTSLPAADAAEDQAFTALVFQPQGKRFAVAGSQGVHIYSTEGGSPEATLDSPAALLSLAYSPDGRILAGGDAAGNVHLWDAGSGELLRTIAAHTDAVQALAFRPDGYLLFTGSADGTIGVWGMPVP